MSLFNNIILEAGINHLGKVSEANKILNFFLKSNFKNLTFMIQRKIFYEKIAKKNFKLPKNFYINAIKLAHKKNKKIGLSVCDPETYEQFSDLKFDFYKLLGISIINKELIDKLRLKKEPIYISLTKGTDKSINKCLKFFLKKNNLKLIYTNMSYNPNHLDLNKITYLKKKFRLPVGYGHHYNNTIPIYLSALFNPSFYFFYIKPAAKKKISFPDNDHAFFLHQLNDICEQISEAGIILAKKEYKYKIKYNI